MGVNYRVAVAVGKDRKGRGALKWCLRTLVKEGDVLLLIHVRPPLHSIPTPMGMFPVAQVDKAIVAAYEQEMSLKITRSLECFQQDCLSYKVKGEIMLVEHESVKKALLEKITELGIGKLVLGSSTHSILTRLMKACRKKMKDKDISVYLSKHSPAFCAILSIRGGRLHTVKDATLSTSLEASDAALQATAQPVADDCQQPPAILRPSNTSEVPDACDSSVGDINLSGNTLQGVLEEGQLSSLYSQGEISSSLSSEARFNRRRRASRKYSHDLVLDLQLLDEIVAASTSDRSSSAASSVLDADYNSRPASRERQRPSLAEHLKVLDDTAARRPSLGSKLPAAAGELRQQRAASLRSRLNEIDSTFGPLMEEVNNLKGGYGDLMDPRSVGSSFWSRGSREYSDKLQLYRSEDNSFQIDTDYEQLDPPLRVRALKEMLASHRSSWDRTTMLSYEDRVKELTDLSTKIHALQSLQSKLLAEAGIDSGSSTSTDHTQSARDTTPVVPSSKNSLDLEETDQLSYELQRVYLAARQANEHIDSEIMQRKAAESAAVRAVEKAEEFALKLLRESAMRAKALELAEYYKKVAEEDAQFYEQEIRAASLAKENVENEATRRRKQGVVTKTSKLRN